MQESFRGREEDPLTELERKKLEERLKEVPILLKQAYGEERQVDEEIAIFEEKVEKIRNRIQALLSEEEEIEEKLGSHL